MQFSRYLVIYLHITNTEIADRGSANEVAIFLIKKYAKLSRPCDIVSFMP